MTLEKMAKEALKDHQEGKTIPLGAFFDLYERWEKFEEDHPFFAMGIVEEMQREDITHPEDFLKGFLAHKLSFDEEEFVMSFAKIKNYWRKW